MHHAAALLSYKPIEAEAVSWAASVVTNGGTVTGGRLAIVSDFITAEKAAGTWALTDDYWTLWGENSPQALTSLKQRRLATVVNAPTFTANRGYGGNGTSSYINTGFLPATHQVAMSGGNLRVAVYQRTDIAANSTAIGVNETATRGLWLRPKGTTNFMGGQANCTSVNSTGTIIEAAGWFAVSRTSTPSNLLQFWKNGATVATPVPGSFTATAPSNALFICAQNTAGAASGWSVSQLGFACIGASLTSAQELAQYNNVNGWAVKIGANIIG